MVALARPAPPHNGARSLAEPQKAPTRVSLLYAYGGVIATRDVTERGLGAIDVATVVEGSAMLPSACAVELLRRHA